MRGLDLARQMLGFGKLGGDVELRATAAVRSVDASRTEPATIIGLPMSSEDINNVAAGHGNGRQVILGGINIYCGSFRGEDKAGSGFEGVLAEMDAIASADEVDAVARIRSALNSASDHILIEADDARLLQPLLRRCHLDLDSRLTVPGDPFDQIARDESLAANPTALKYGAGLGWRAYCARNLLKAFEVSDAESEPVALVW